MAHTYSYRGFSVNKSQKIPSGDAWAFEFRNKGETTVRLNGITLYPGDEFKEVQNYPEKVGLYYDVTFENQPGLKNELIVIEKRYLTK